jgi:hypothetical protein
MYSTSKGTSLVGCGGRLPRMWWPLSRLQFLPFLPHTLLLVIPHILLLVGEQFGQPEQR